MEENKLLINEGKTEAFLICDKQLEQTDRTPFVQWLKSEGFVYGFRKGWYGCPWMYLSITKKKYSHGMPGVGYVQELGNHAITVEEFKTIYQIYKKYEDKDLFVFHEERFDYDE